MAPLEKPASPDRQQPGAESSDASLLSVFRKGGQDAATQLYFRYAHRLRTLVRHNCSADLARCMEADDIVQSVFRTFFSGAKEGLYRIPRGDDLWRLLLVMALYKVRSKGEFHNAAKRDIRKTFSLETSDQELGLDPEKRSDSEELMFLQVAVREALEQLPADYRVIVELRIEGYEIPEIAGKVGRARRTVERILQEARKKLGTLLQIDDHDI